MADITEVYGISNTDTNIVIESATETENPQLEQVPNDKNQITAEIKYDIRYDLNLTYRGTKITGTTVDYGDKTYIIDSHQSAGTYNGLKRYTITGHCYKHCNSLTAA